MSRLIESTLTGKISKILTESKDPYDDPESWESQHLGDIQNRYDEYLQDTEGRGISWGEIAYIQDLRGKDLEDFEKELDDYFIEKEDKLDESNPAFQDKYKVIIDGKEIKPGDKIKDFRGDEHVFKGVTNPGTPWGGMNGKIVVASDTMSGEMEYYPSVFSAKLEKIEEAAKPEEKPKKADDLKKGEEILNEEPEDTEYVVQFWEDEDCREEGLSDLEYLTAKDLKDAIAQTRKMCSLMNWESCELLKKGEEDSGPLFGIYPEGEETYTESAKPKKLKEWGGDWQGRINSGSELRNLLHEMDEDASPEECRKVLDVLKKCCQEAIEICEKNNLDEYDKNGFQSVIDDIEMIYDDEDLDSSNVDWELDGFYDWCDSARLWVELSESFKPRKKKLTEAIEGLPDFCYSSLPSDNRKVIKIVKGESGYYPLDVDFEDAEKAQAYIKDMNDKLGIDDRTKRAMETGSMWGWDVPGADPNHKMNESYKPKLKEALENMQAFWEKGFKPGDKIESSGAGEVELIDLNKAGDYVLLKRNSSYQPYVAAWAPSLNDEGKLYWGQGHYYDNENEAREYFNSKKLNESLDPNDKVIVVCYDSMEVWPNQKSAMNFYMTGVSMCEGSEKERYANIVSDLYDNVPFAEDGVSDYINKVCVRDNDGGFVSQKKLDTPVKIGSKAAKDLMIELAFNIDKIDESAKLKEADENNWLKDRLVLQVVYENNKVTIGTEDSSGDTYSCYSAGDLKTAFDEYVDNYIDDELNESVTVATSDGSTVDMQDSASVSVDDNVVSVTNGQTTVTLTTTPDLPVEELVSTVPADASLTEPQEEPVEEVPAEEIMPEEPEAEESEEEEVVEESDEPYSFDKGYELERLHSDDEEESDEYVFDKERELERLHADENESVIEAQTLDVVKNQGDVYMLTTKDAEGNEKYWVCENFDQENNEGEEAEEYDSLEDANDDYLSRVGLSDYKNIE